MLYSVLNATLSDKNVAQLAQPKEAAIMQQLRLLHGGDYNPDSGWTGPIFWRRTSTDEKGTR